MTDIQEYAENAASTVLRAVSAVEVHVSSEDLACLFRWFAGLVVYAYEYQMRTTQPMGDRFDWFFDRVIELTGLDYERRFGSLQLEYDHDDEEDDATFYHAVEDAFTDADVLWPDFIAKLRDGLGFQAFPQAMKGAYMFSDNADLFTIAFLMNAILMEDLTKAAP